MNGEVLLITEAGYPWAIGGVTTWINDLVTGLPDRKMTVLGIRFDQPEAPSAASLLPPGVRFIDVPLEAPLQMAGVVEAVLGAIAGSMPAVVHATTSGIAGLAGVAISQVSGAPLVVTEHGIAWMGGADNSPARLDGDKGKGNDGGQGDGGDGHGHDGGGGGDDGGHGDDGHGNGGGGHSVVMWDSEARRVARVVYRKALRITSVSHANTVFQRRLAPQKAPIEVIPNGVAVPPLAGSLLEQRHARTVAFVGRVSPEKGVDRFIDIAAALGKEYPDLRFEVRGPENSDHIYGRICRTQAEAAGLAGRLTFTGALPRPLAFEGVDLLVVPSRLEACPYVVLEAMAAGVPVVASDVGDCAGILAGAGAAVRGKTTAFVKAAAPLLDPAGRITAAHAGRARVATWFSLERMLNRYRDLYTELERQRKRSRWTA